MLRVNKDFVSYDVSPHWRRYILRLKRSGKIEQPSSIKIGIKKSFDPAKMQIYFVMPDLIRHPEPSIVKISGFRLGGRNDDIRQAAGY